MNSVEVIARGARGGKTFDCVKRLKNDPKSVLLVFHVGERLRIRDEYALSPEDLSRIFTFTQLLRGDLKGGVFSQVIIDNVDLFLKAAVQANLSGECFGLKILVSYTPDHLDKAG